jgi:hypothetical protein
MSKKYDSASPLTLSLIRSYGFEDRKQFLNWCSSNRTMSFAYNLMNEEGEILRSKHRKKWLKLLKSFDLDIQAYFKECNEQEAMRKDMLKNFMDDTSEEEDAIPTKKYSDEKQNIEKPKYFEKQNALETPKYPTATEKQNIEKQNELETPKYPTDTEKQFFAILKNENQKWTVENAHLDMISIPKSKLLSFIDNLQKGNIEPVLIELKSLIK